MRLLFVLFIVPCLGLPPSMPSGGKYDTEAHPTTTAATTTTTTYSTTTPATTTTTASTTTNPTTASTTTAPYVQAEPYKGEPPKEMYRSANSYKGSEGMKPPVYQTQQYTSTTSRPTTQYPQGQGKFYQPTAQPQYPGNTQPQYSASAPQYPSTAQPQYPSTAKPQYPANAQPQYAANAQPQYAANAQPHYAANAYGQGAGMRYAQSNAYVQNYLGLGCPPPPIPVCPPCPCMPRMMTYPSQGAAAAVPAYRSPYPTPVPSTTTETPYDDSKDDEEGKENVSGDGKRYQRSLFDNSDYWSGLGQENYVLNRVDMGYAAQHQMLDALDKYGPPLHVGSIQASDFNYPNDFHLFNTQGYQEQKTGKRKDIYSLVGPLDVNFDPTNNLIGPVTTSQDVFRKLVIQSGTFQLNTFQKNGIMKIQNLNSGTVYVVDCNNQTVGHCRNLVKINQ